MMKAARFKLRRAIEEGEGVAVVNAVATFSSVIVVGVSEDEAKSLLMEVPEGGMMLYSSVNRICAITKVPLK